MDQNLIQILNNDKSFRYEIIFRKPYLAALQILTMLDGSTHRVYAKYECRVGFNHGWRIFDDTPQSIHIQVEDHDHNHCTDSKYCHSSQVYSCSEQKINRYIHYNIL